MTLRELFQQIGENPNFLLFYFLIIPSSAAIAGILGKDEGHLSPWKYLYATLIYLVSIPGIFAVALNAYFFLFQRGDVMQTDVYLQILPIIVMVLTIFLIRRNVDLSLVPGFDKISGLWFMLFTTMLLMWLLEKIHIVVFSYLPFQYLLVVFAVLFALIYLGWRRFIR
ncbi:hypothetical protein Emtol_3541 [Emticicia oligotrophica DSM 17448]|uniref:Uncharacterized protein n=1 Tax=Emticicia oligotrophica (strain DSM 17448 / CIP 109782 / MTCC 6937 / GPTSA100-15) TaxID=929562 RepID=A0ABN4AQH8_EMTOG|nr:hypothetical protein [Emticicia oligotrophica]AFK04669.1 hypothetical protein Emtol_3541 [Emticicia oligotrophica DSM 17448]